MSLQSPSCTLNNYPSYPRAVVVWGLGAALYLMGFYLRVAPAVITDKLMADFQIGAAALGNLSAFYYYSYVAMQIPTGFLADSWGPRKLLTAGGILAGVGTLFFGLSPNLVWANLCRLLIGGSVAVAFVAMLKLAGHWFHPRRFAMISGLALLSGLIGAIGAGVPLRALVDLYGWRPVMVGSAVTTFLIAGITWLLVRDDPSQCGYSSFASGAAAATQQVPGAGIGSSFRVIFRHRNAWLLVLAPSGVVGAVLTFSGLWGVPFLTTHYHLSPAMAAAVTSTLMIAWGLGGPVLGIWSDRLGRRKPLYVIGCALSACGWGILLFVPQLPMTFFLSLVVLTGFSSGCMTTGFAFVKESVPPAYAGTVSGIVNMGVMVGPMVQQPAIGWILDRNWKGEMIHGVRIYDLAAYRKGFLLMLAWSVLAAILILFTKETHCRQTIE